MYARPLIITHEVDSLNATVRWTTEPTKYRSNYKKTNFSLRMQKRKQSVRITSNVLNEL